jgi:hypothetical protein
MASGSAASYGATSAEMIRAFELYRSAAFEKNEGRNKIAQEIWKIHVDQVFSIGLVGQSPAYMGTRVVSSRLENVPERTCIPQHCRTPCSGHPKQWFYK